MASNVETDQVIPLLAEDLTITRIQSATGAVRVSTRVISEDRLVDEALTHTNAHVEHIAVNRMVDEMPQIRVDGDTTIIPVVEEIIVVERKLLLREEVHIRRVETVHRHTETVTLRREEAVVVRDPAGLQPIADGAAISHHQTEGNIHGK